VLLPSLLQVRLLLAVLPPLLRVVVRGARWRRGAVAALEAAGAARR
jgi:hypothetical protein